MFQKQLRLQREYLYRKASASTLINHAKKKNLLKAAYDDNKPIPVELRGEALELHSKLDLGDASAATIPDSKLDDEYANISNADVGQVLITTSRNPSIRLHNFVKELKLLIPTSKRVNRGHMILSDIKKFALSSGILDVVIAHEYKGVASGLIISHLPCGPTAYFTLSDLVLRSDISQRLPPISTKDPLLIFENFGGNLGKRIQAIINSLFLRTTADSTRVCALFGAKNSIIFRHYMYQIENRSRKNFEDEDVNEKENAKEESIKSTIISGVDQEGSSGKQIILSEIGPRFVLTPYLIELGTFDESHLKVDWALKRNMKAPRDTFAADLGEEATAGEGAMAREGTTAGEGSTLPHPNPKLRPLHKIHKKKEKVTEKKLQKQKKLREKRAIERIRRDKFV